MVWEYLVLYYNYDASRMSVQEELDRYGLDRWELVSVVYNPLKEQLQYFLKRESLERIA